MSLKNVPDQISTPSQNMASILEELKSYYQSFSDLAQIYNSTNVLLLEYRKTLHSITEATKDLYSSYSSSLIESISALVECGQFLFAHIEDDPGTRPAELSCSITDSDISAICKAVDDSLENTQEYISIEQFDELKAQIADLKDQLTSSDTPEEKKFNFDRLIAIVSVLLSIFFYILDNHQDNQANQQLLDNQAVIIQSLENIDRKLDSHIQSQESSSSSKE